MKSEKQLKDLIEKAKTQESRGLLGHSVSDADQSTNSWGPQMRV